MKTNRQEFPGPTSTVTRLHTLCRALPIVVLALFVLQLQLFVPLAFAKSQTAEQWSLQIERVDPAGANLEPSFSAAIYENLLQELSKSKQFKQVFRSGDRNANDVSRLLVLKTVVEKYTAGSETRRAVTTISGATKLRVRVQLVTRDGHVVLEQTVAGNVRFIGSNLRVTHNLAHNIAKSLKQSALPQPTQETGKDSTLTP